MRILLKYGSTLIECCIAQLLRHVKIDYEDGMGASATGADEVATSALNTNCIDFLSSMCLNCGASNPIMYRCNKCKRFCYCSKKCQRKNLQYHKAICKEI